MYLALEICDAFESVATSRVHSLLVLLISSTKTSVVSTGFSIVFSTGVSAGLPVLSSSACKSLIFCCTVDTISSGVEQCCNNSSSDGRDKEANCDRK